MARGLAFKNVYVICRCFNKNLPMKIYEQEEITRKEATDYINPSVDLISFQKVGFFKYLMVWKVQGYLKD